MTRERKQDQYYSTYSAKVENKVFLYKSWTRNWARTESLPLDVSTKLSQTVFFMLFEFTVLNVLR